MPSCEPGDWETALQLIERRGEESPLATVVSRVFYGVSRDFYGFSMGFQGLWFVFWLFLFMPLAALFWAFFFFCFWKANPRKPGFAYAFLDEMLLLDGVVVLSFFNF